MHFLHFIYLIEFYGSQFILNIIIQPPKMRFYYMKKSGDNSTYLECIGMGVYDLLCFRNHEILYAGVIKNCYKKIVFKWSEILFFCVW